MDAPAAAAAATKQQSCNHLMQVVTIDGLWQQGESHGASASAASTPQPYTSLTSEGTFSSRTCAKSQQQQQQQQDEPLRY
jgi:hypothetical protein